MDDINGKIRLAGYKEALKKAKLTYSEGLVFESKYSYDDGYQLAERVIASKATAAFVTGDELAAGIAPPARPGPAGRPAKAACAAVWPGVAKNHSGALCQ